MTMHHAIRKKLLESGWKSRGSQHLAGQHTAGSWTQ